MAEDPLEVSTLPSDPREMALRLLGMTVSELKEIDSRVISGQQYVGGLKSDLNKIVSEVTTHLAPKQLNNANNKQPQIPAAEIQAEQSVLINQEIPQPIEKPVNVEQNNDDDQLQFNFYRKVKPEDLEYQLKKLTSSVEDLTVKLDLVYNHLLKKSTRKINGTYST
jgi:hypothetical protein